MAIRSGQFLHVGNGFIVDRIQTGGVSSLNIPKEVIKELGNFANVATVRDIPDLSFEVESLDVSTEIEALITGQDPTATLAGDEFDFANALPMDIISPFKSGINAFDIVKGVVVPYLTLESVAYSFGFAQSASQTFSFKGDSLNYVQGSPYYEEITLVNNVLTYGLAETADLYEEAGEDLYALSVCVKNPVTYKSKRLFISTHYTNTPTAITLLDDWFDEGYTVLHVTYGSQTPDTYLQTVHQNVSVKPASVKGKDICVYVAQSAATPTLELWSGVQSTQHNRRVNLEADYEFCNTKAVTYDYDTADVTGQIVVKSIDPDDLFDKIAQIANVGGTDIIGPFTSQPLEVETQIKDPETGVVVKTLYVPDARFTIPNLQGRVNTKLEATFTWESDSGTLLVYDGERP